MVHDASRIHWSWSLLLNTKAALPESQTLTLTAQANAVHFVRIAGNPVDRCAHECGLDHTAVVLSAVIVAMFIFFQLAWTCAIVSARAPSP